jgi:hypothetical protein
MRCTEASIAVGSSRRPSGTSSGSTFKNSQLEIHDITEAGSEIVVWNTAYMWGRDGIEVTATSALVFTVESGKIICMRLFHERAEALEAVGLSE